MISSCIAAYISTSHAISILLLGESHALTSDVHHDWPASNCCRVCSPSWPLISRLETFHAYDRSSAGKAVGVTVTIPRAQGPFQVLFPVIDAFNHDHTVEVNWAYENGSFGMTIEDPRQDGQEIVNNYGRKSNEECKHMLKAESGGELEVSDRWQC
jgi:hypothetical protein